ncbi:MAG TPA: hypothetical protein VHP83_07770 [Aggregatilineaceae bacterium]|nr:hypothetical protein [Aggregatilineaceae bacterium]
MIILAGALIVFGGYFVWTGFLRFLDSRGSLTYQTTQTAVASVTSAAITPPARATIFVPVTFTPLPPCQIFTVDVDRAVYRECPLQDNVKCPIVATVTYGTELCVYARAPENREWLVVDLNPTGAYRKIVFIHESVVEALHPTPTPTRTAPPLPTVTPVPTDTPYPTPLISPTDTPDPSTPPTPTPTLTPSRTPQEVVL